MENNVLPKYNTKSWFKSALLGFLIGLAIIIPGVSGSTIAIMFSLYTAILFAFGNIFKSFKQCFFFLVPIVIGIGVGFLLGFVVIQKIYDLMPFTVICLFAGLMLGAFPIVYDEIRPLEKKPKSIALAVVGLLIPIAIGIVSISLSGGVDTNATYEGFPFYLFPLYLVLGYVIAITQVVPGLSATCILMAVGQFRLIMNALHSSYLFEHPIVILLFAMLAIGFVIGIITFSKVISHFIEKSKKSTFTLIVGLSLGSVISMFINPEIFNVYKGWSAGGKVALDISIGALLLIIGFVLAYLLVRYERKVKAQKAEKIEATTETTTEN